MRLLITHPYHLILDPREHALARPYPPLGTLQAAAAARAAGHTVVFYDPMFAKSEAAFEPILARGNFDAVAIVADDHSVQIKQCLGRIQQAQQTMAKMAAQQGVPVLVTGPHPSDHPEDYLSSGAEDVVSGEPVTALVDWLNHRPGDPGIPGIHGQRGAGGKRPPETDLDALPDPAWDLCDLKPYAEMWRSRHGYWEINIWTARGCPYRCNWCAKPVWGRSYQVRAAARVVNEIRLLHQQHGFDRIWFTDDIFGLRPTWLSQFRDLIHENAIPYRCLSRVDLMQTTSYVEDLAQSGCNQVWVGAESGSNRILQAMDKDCTVDDIRTATALLQQHGIRIGFFLQLGYPGESLNDVRSTVEMVRSLRPDEIGVSVTYPMPGTKFFDHVEDTMKTSNWSTSMDNRTLFEAPYPEPFYSAAKELLRSTHSSNGTRAALHAFLKAPDGRAGRRLAGALFHRVRRPWVEHQMVKLAVPNPNAVPLTWNSAQRPATLIRPKQSPDG